MQNAVPTCNSNVPAPLVPPPPPPCENNGKSSVNHGNNIRLLLP